MGCSGSQPSLTQQPVLIAEIHSPPRNHNPQRPSRSPGSNLNTYSNSLSV